MKKFFGVFLAMAFCFITFSSEAQALDAKKVVNTTKAIAQEFVKHENDSDFRDFDFLVKMTLVQLNAWNDSINKNNSKEKNLKISQQYVAMLSGQYINMQQYLKSYVIAKSNNKNATQKKCLKLMKLIAEGLEALK